MIIRTDRLVLRPFMAEDFCWFKEVARNEEVKILLPGVACDDDANIKESIVIYSKCDFVNDFYYVICDKNNNALGIVIAVRVENILIDVSYFLKKEFRHQGYMRESLKELINDVRKIQPLYKFRFVIAEYNEASLNVVRSLGATFESVFGHYICHI